MRSLASLSSLGGLGPGRGYSPAIALGDDLLAHWEARRADTLTIGVGGAVSSWRDLKFGYDAVQATGGSQPIYAVSSFGGDAGLSFDGVNDVLVAPSPFPSGSSPSELWVLLSQDALVADASERMVFSMGGNNNNSRKISRVVSSGENRARASSADGAMPAPSTQNTIDFTGRHAVRAIFSATSVQCVVDGAAAASAAVTMNTLNTRVTIGALSSSATGSAFWSGQIAAVLVTNPLSPDRAAALQAWLMGRRRL